MLAYLGEKRRNHNLISNIIYSKAMKEKAQLNESMVDFGMKAKSRNDDGGGG